MTAAPRRRDPRQALVLLRRRRRPALARHRRHPPSDRRRRGSGRGRTLGSATRLSRNLAGGRRSRRRPGSSPGAGRSMKPDDLLPRVSDELRGLAAAKLASNRASSLIPASLPPPGPILSPWTIVAAVPSASRSGIGAKKREISKRTQLRPAEPPFFPGNSPVPAEQLRKRSQSNPTFSTNEPSFFEERSQLSRKRTQRLVSRERLSFECNSCSDRVAGVEPRRAPDLERSRPGGSPRLDPSHPDVVNHHGQ